MILIYDSIKVAVIPISVTDAFYLLLRLHMEYDLSIIQGYV